MNNIFLRNIGALTLQEQESLSKSKVFIAGCGGLGGFAAEFCARAGIGSIAVCDKDKFDETNLNRQRFCDIYSIGQSKSAVMREKLLDINPTANITALNIELNDGNVSQLIEGSNVVIDALDNIKSRLILEKACAKNNIPMVFGAVRGWTGQISTIYPNDNSLSVLYKNSEEEEKPSVLAFTPAIISGLQVAEAVNILLKKPNLRKKLLLVDLEDFSFQTLAL